MKVPKFDMNLVMWGGVAVVALYVTGKLKSLMTWAQPSVDSAVHSLDLFGTNEMEKENAAWNEYAIGSYNERLSTRQVEIVELIRNDPVFALRDAKGWLSATSSGDQKLVNEIMANWRAAGKHPANVLQRNGIRVLDP